MSRGLVWLLALSPTLAFAGPGTPMNWSPDGRWIAYTVSVPVEPATLPSGWLFETRGERPRRDNRFTPNRLSRIYAADSESGSMVVLQESSRPLTTPAWSPDGRTLAFGRVVDNGGGGAPRCEWVVQDAPDHDRVILKQSLPDKSNARDDWGGVVPAWSPDGHYLAVPDLKAPPGLLVIGVDQGKIFGSIEQASFPAWSPDGTKLAFLRGDQSSSLLVSELELGRTDGTATPSGAYLHFGPPTHLVDLGQEHRAPVWSRDGKSLTAVASRKVLRGRGPTLQVDLLRVKVDSGVMETVAHFTPDPLEQEEAFHGVALSYDRDVEELFHSLDLGQQPAAIVWSRPKSQETINRFNPVDIALKVRSLSFSPVSKKLAIRFGESGDDSTLAIYDVVEKKLRLLVDDEVSRLGWMTRLLTTARQLLRLSVPQAVAGPRPVQRPSILPVPGEIPLNTEFVVRLQRLGRLGRPLCEPGGGSEATDPQFRAFRDEARLVFDALREDYAGALAALDAVETRASTADQRERLLAVRAQFFIGLSDVERAADTIGFLRSFEDSAVRRIEITPAGTTLIPEPNLTKGWAEYLASRLEDLEKSDPSRASRREEATGLPDPALTAPPALQGVPFGRLPDGVFVDPRNGPFPAAIVRGRPGVRPRIAQPRPAEGPLPAEPRALFRAR